MDLGGLQRIVNLLIQRIDKSLFEPYLCCLDQGGMFYGQASSQTAGSFILNRRPGPFDGRLFIQLYSILREKKIDIIHSQNGCSLYAALAGRLAKVKGIVHTDHGRLVPDRKTAIFEDRFSSCMMNRFIGVSDELTSYLARVVKISRKKLMTIINGVDTTIFRPATAEDKTSLRAEIGLSGSDNIIGSVCRFDPIKNLEFLISCMPAILKQTPDTKLVLVGDGPSREGLVTYAESLGLESRIVFLGRKENVERILPTFDVYACSSLSEGTSMTILEAMACGIPIVASSVGGNPKLVDSSNGVLFTVNDSKIFIEAITELLHNPALIQQKGTKSREKVLKSYSLDTMLSQYEHLYLSLVSTP